MGERSQRGNFVIKEPLPKHLELRGEKGNSGFSRFHDDEALNLLPKYAIGKRVIGEKGGRAAGPIHRKPPSGSTSAAPRVEEQTGGKKKKIKGGAQGNCEKG